jgi:release factor glutamine methyltransferase
VRPTVGSALRTTIPRLEAAGIDTPRLDAELLLAHVLHTDRLSLFAHPERVLSAEEAARFEAAVRRRERREPLPYITGTREFLGLTFRVTRAVLIPRPETELLVEAVAARLGARPHPRLLDVGTGSGCVAIGLAHLLPEATVVAVEPSEAALAVAQENAVSLGVSDRIERIHGSFPEAVADRSGEFDAVVSNPPYIPEGELAGLQTEVRDWEPREALTAGPVGLELICALIAHTPRLLRRAGDALPGLLAMEVALGQAERVLRLLQESGEYSDVEAVPDLAGIPRVCIGRLAAAENPPFDGGRDPSFEG